MTRSRDAGSTAVQVRLGDKWISRTAAATVAGPWHRRRLSYSHMRQLAQDHGHAGWHAHVFPLSVDGIEIVASLVLIADRRAGRRSGWLPWTALAVGTAGASPPTSLPRTRTRSAASSPAGRTWHCSSPSSSWPASERTQAPTALTQPTRQAKPTNRPRPPPRTPDQHQPVPLNSQPAPTLQRSGPVPGNPETNNRHRSFQQPTRHLTAALPRFCPPPRPPETNSAATGFRSPATPSPPDSASTATESATPTSPRSSTDSGTNSPRTSPPEPQPRDPAPSQPIRRSHRPPKEEAHPPAPPATAGLATQTSCWRAMPSR